MRRDVKSALRKWMSVWECKNLFGDMSARIVGKFQSVGSAGE